MTKETIKRLLKRYDKKLAEEGYTVMKSNGGGFINYSDEEFGESLRHCRRMITQMDDLIKAGDMDKVNRWLGFIQGCLWNGRIYTLPELKMHNRK
jgi:hypothetical protein